MVKFPAQLCAACPARDQCTTATHGGRQRTLHPRQVQHALDTARAEQDTRPWQADYALRAGVEAPSTRPSPSPVCAAPATKGLPKTHLEHVYAAVALNLIRLDARWNRHALDRTRTSHLTRLELALAA